MKTNKTIVYEVWARSSYRDIYKVCSNYKEALAMRKEMRAIYGNEFKYTIMLNRERYE